MAGSARQFGNEGEHNEEDERSGAVDRRGLQMLEAKRAELIERGKPLPALRRAAAFAAHVEKSAEARRALDQINFELSTRFVQTL
jgi:hypothetical protein